MLTGPSRVAGALSSGLHHARADRGAGFCTFNGLAVTAHAALDFGAERPQVLDLDAHCGGGTRSMTDPDSVVQIDVSTVGFDRWSPRATMHPSWPAPRTTFLGSPRRLGRPGRSLRPGALQRQHGPGRQRLRFEPEATGTDGGRVGRWPGAPVGVRPGRWVHRRHHHGGTDRSAQAHRRRIWVTTPAQPHLKDP
jgi:hypothetical protein